MDITRSFIETAVDKALRDIRRDPARSIRNTVDLGQNFSRGRFLSQFLGVAQTMLAKRDSAYYEVAKRLAATVDPGTLRTFGVNLGYEALTKGAGRIRALEARTGYNIPWTIVLHYARGDGNLTPADLRRLIDAGRALGIEAYMLFCRASESEDLVPLLQANEQSAFVLLLDAPDGFIPGSMAALTGCRNALISLASEGPGLSDAVAFLRERGCLLSTHTRYCDDTLDGMLAAPAIERLLPLRCTFAIYIAEAGTSPQAQKAMRSHIIGIREAQRYPAFLLDFFSDLLYVDEVISSQACFFGVRADGSIDTRDGKAHADRIQSAALMDILQNTMPRATYLNG